MSSDENYPSDPLAHNKSTWADRAPRKREEFQLAEPPRFIFRRGRREPGVRINGKSLSFFDAWEFVDAISSAPERRRMSALLCEAEVAFKREVAENTMSESRRVTW